MKFQIQNSKFKILPAAFAAGNGVFGEIGSPTALGGVESGAVITLLNNLLRLIFIVAGLFVLFQILIAGINYTGAAGDPQKIQNAQDRIWQSLMGLIIMIASFIAAVIIGAIFLDDPMAILNPRIPAAR